jgi:hypothetical protein
MTLILRSHVTLGSEKTRINIAVRGRVKMNDYLVKYIALRMPINEHKSNPKCYRTNSLIIFLFFKLYNFILCK